MELCDFQVALQTDLMLVIMYWKWFSQCGWMFCVCFIATFRYMNVSWIRSQWLRLSKIDINDCIIYPGDKWEHREISEMESLQIVILNHRKWGGVGKAGRWEMELQRVYSSGAEKPARIIYSGLKLFFPSSLKDITLFQLDHFSAFLIQHITLPTFLNFYYPCLSSPLNSELFADIDSHS